MKRCSYKYRIQYYFYETIRLSKRNTYTQDHSALLTNFIHSSIDRDMPSLVILLYPARVFKTTNYQNLFDSFGNIGKVLLIIYS